MHSPSYTRIRIVVQIIKLLITVLLFLIASFKATHMSVQGYVNWINNTLKLNYIT